MTPARCVFSHILHFAANLTVRQGNKKTAAPKTLAEERVIAAAAHQAKLSSISREITARHLCDEHKSADYVGADGKHIRFTIPQLTMWAELIVSTHLSSS
jgi:hypothetical protein